MMRALAILTVLPLVVTTPALSQNAQSRRVLHHNLIRPSLRRCVTPEATVVDDLFVGLIAPAPACSRNSDLNR